MPSNLPWPSSLSAVFSAACAASASVRSIGTCPTAVKNQRLNQPFRPLPVKYSDFARKVMRRRTTSGRKKLSITARWLLARITGPELGTCSSPSTFGRPSNCSNGPRKMYLSSQYHMALPLARLDDGVGANCTDPQGRRPPSAASGSLLDGDRDGLVTGLRGGIAGGGRLGRDTAAGRPRPRPGGGAG